MERNNNKELEQFNSCLEIKLVEGKLICSRCKPQFSQIKIGNELKCVYTPTLYDSNFKGYYYINYIKQLNLDMGNVTNFIKNNYLFRQTQFLPCKESINLGSSENPLYSCTKCYNIFDNEEYDFYHYDDYEDFEDDFYLDLYDYFYYQYSYYNDDEDENYIKDTMPVKIDDEMTKNSYCIR